MNPRIHKPMLLALSAVLVLCAACGDEKDAGTQGGKVKDAASDATTTAVEPIAMLDIRSLVPDTAPEGFTRVPDGSGSGLFWAKDVDKLSYTPELPAQNGFARAYRSYWEGPGDEELIKVVLEFNSELGAAEYSALTDAPSAEDSDQRQLPEIGGTLEVLSDVDIPGTKRVGARLTRDRWLFSVVAMGVPVGTEETRVADVEKYVGEFASVPLPSGPAESAAVQACREAWGVFDFKNSGLSTVDIDMGILAGLERAVAMLGDADGPASEELRRVVAQALRGMQEGDMDAYKEGIGHAFDLCFDLGLEEEIEQKRTAADDRNE